MPHCDQCWHCLLRGLPLGHHHFTWLTTQPGKGIQITGTWRTGVQVFFTEPNVSRVWSCFLFFYYHWIVLQRMKVNMVQECVKSIKNMISIWLLKLNFSLSFGYYNLGCCFISSSQFSKPLKHVLNSSQEFRHPTCFNPTYHLCSFTYTCPQFRRALQHTFNRSLSYSLFQVIIIEVSPFFVSISLLATILVFIFS